LQQAHNIHQNDVTPLCCSCEARDCQNGAYILMFNSVSIDCKTIILFVVGNESLPTEVKKCLYFHQ